MQPQRDLDQQVENQSVSDIFLEEPKFLKVRYKQMSSEKKYTVKCIGNLKTLTFLNLNLCLI